MGIADAARDKAHAKVTELEAEVTKIKAQLEEAQENLGGAQAAGDLLGSVQDTPVVGDLTSGMRRDATVDQASGQADVARLQSELSSAETKLEWARKAEAAVEAVTGDEG